MASKPLSLRHGRAPSGLDLRWLLSAEAYGVVVAVTCAAAAWRGGAALRACALALFLSWAVSRLMAGRLDLSGLAVAHAFIHIVLLLLFVLLLTRVQALWLMLLTALAAVQAAANLGVVLVADPGAAGPLPAYEAVVAAVFGLQLACLWLALTRAGRWWPARWAQSRA